MPKLELEYFVEYSSCSGLGHLVLKIIYSEHPRYIKGQCLQASRIVKAMFDGCEISIKPLTKEVDEDVDMLTKFELFED